MNKKAIASLLMACAMISPIKALASTIHVGDKPHKYAQDIEACQAQPELGWCGESILPDKPTPVTLDLLSRVDKLMRATWTEGDEMPTDKTTWRSYRADARAGKPWKGLCADLTFSVLDQLQRTGIDPRRMWRLVVKVNPNDPDDLTHMVAVVQTDDGGLYVVGDALVKGPYPYHTMRYTPLYASNVALHALAWFEVR